MGGGGVRGGMGGRGGGVLLGRFVGEGRGGEGVATTRGTEVEEV